MTTFQICLPQQHTFWHLPDLSFRFLLVALLSGITHFSALAQPAMCHASGGMELFSTPNSAIVQPADRARIVAEAERIRRADYCPFTGLEFHGHANQDEESADGGRALSLRRAENVATLFELNGFPKSYLTVAAKAATQPVAPTADKRNARVEVVLLGGCPNIACSMPASSSGLRLAR